MMIYEAQVSVCVCVRGSTDGVYKAGKAQYKSSMLLGCWVTCRLPREAFGYTDALWEWACLG